MLFLPLREQHHTLNLTGRHSDEWPFDGHHNVADVARQGADQERKVDQHRSAGGCGVLTMERSVHRHEELFRNSTFLVHHQTSRGPTLCRRNFFSCETFRQRPVGSIAHDDCCFFAILACVIYSKPILLVEMRSVFHFAE